ncbi:H/ACA ribonucleoprotein complex subunit 1 [Labeo rohita]|uniref:H/ACA ribonucleoprotein complex subunit n=1 Tax=Labeo rohita TaxID=84645 RepID=A0ABQ8M2V8_LABRO|nr:H/ACA ribonucleoprotein complex subunit 1 [Labeo rohita]
MIRLHFDISSFNIRLFNVCFTGSLSCHFAGVVVEEGVVTVVLTEVVVEEDLEGVEVADLEGAEADLEGVEVAEVDLTEIKTMAHRNKLSVIIGIHAPRVSAVGEFMHPCEDDIVCKSVTENNQVPYFNAPVYLENKEQIGKVDEIFGQLRDFYFSVKLSENMKASSFKKLQKVRDSSLGLQVRRDHPVEVEEEEVAEEVASVEVVVVVVVEDLVEDLADEEVVEDLADEEVVVEDSEEAEVEAVDVDSEVISYVDHQKIMMELLNSV